MSARLLEPLVLFWVVTTMGGLHASPAPQTDAAAIIRQDLTGSDRGKRVAAFVRYAANGNQEIARQAIEAAMVSDDWLLQAAVVRDVVSRLGSLPITFSISPDFPRADPAPIEQGRYALTIGRLNRETMTFTGGLQASRETPAAAGAGAGGGGTRLGGVRGLGAAPLMVRGGNAGQLLGTVLTLSGLSTGQDMCVLQLSLSEPWIMTGRLYCQGSGTYAARADLRTMVPATRPPDEEEKVGDYFLQPWQRPGYEAVRARRQQLDAEAAKPRRAWAVTDPAERSAIERDAKIVNELLALLRRSASAEALGVLEALAADGLSVTSDLALEAGLASSLPAARQFAFHMALARTKVLLLVEEPAVKPADGGPPRGARFAALYSSQYAIGSTLGRNIPLDAIAPGARMSGLLSQITLEGLLYLPNYIATGESIRLAIDEFGRIRGTLRTPDLTRRGATMVETSYVVPSLIR